MAVSEILFVFINELLMHLLDCNYLRFQYNNVNLIRIDTYLKICIRVNLLIILGYNYCCWY